MPQIFFFFFLLFFCVFKWHSFLTIIRFSAVKFVERTAGETLVSTFTMLSVQICCAVPNSPAYHFSAKCELFQFLCAFQRCLLNY